MQNAISDVAYELPSIVPVAGGDVPYMVELVDGRMLDIASLDARQLRQLQCEQEPAFASAIAMAPKDSAERVQRINTGYATVCAILDRLRTLTVQDPTTQFSMGMDPRYAQLVLELLAKQRQREIEGGLFEVGFSTGVLLRQVAESGFPVGGVEVVADLVVQAKRKLQPQHHERLLLGDFRQLDLRDHQQQYSLVYWNDVFEHIPVDEIQDYLMTIRSLLRPGGLLVSITPNWHMRPSDVTIEFKPPRSPAVGFHLKEYTLAEVCGLLRQAGFRQVHSPNWISRSRIHYHPRLDATPLKVLCEPLLEWLPYRLAVQVCRRAGFNCTIAMN